MATASRTNPNHEGRFTVCRRGSRQLDEESQLPQSLGAPPLVGHFHPQSQQEKCCRHPIRRRPAELYARRSLWVCLTFCAPLDRADRTSDPHPYSVILWTRASPTFANVNDNSSVSGLTPLYGHGSYNNSKVTTAPICVQYRIADCQDFTNVVDSDIIYTSSDIDFTVKVRAHRI